MESKRKAGERHANLRDFNGGRRGREGGDGALKVGEKSRLIESVS
jgi:hypothetical protein